MMGGRPFVNGTDYRMQSAGKCPLELAGLYPKVLNLLVQTAWHWHGLFVKNIVLSESTICPATQWNILDHPSK